MTETSYSNDQLTYQLIQPFYEWTLNCTLGAKWLVLYDRFGSHLTQNFIQFCQKNNIVLLLHKPDGVRGDNAKHLFA